MSASAEIEITFADSTVRRFPRGVPAGEALGVSNGASGEHVIAATVDGRVVDLSRPLTADCTLRAVSVHSPEGLDVLRHSAAHLMAQAVKRLFPSVQVTIGPTIAGGFYYDLKFERPAFPGDTLYLEMEVAEKQRSESGRHGTITMLWECLNQHGERLLSARPTLLFRVES